ncbi:putative palmitoyltransferase ZDHHC7 [Apostichopus japonicus]|uniref:Putative palmitoyltransferase ZDHHC7 n=1 Tax=Stichopus japonicus TaxID=307972 RepID=A0A2G8L2H3_STIJA|nr:putative palmitoyltransferase ZDHHC7 [Apostichopus japonicus]
MPFRDDPCGIFCIMIVYAAVCYADYVIIAWIILPSMSLSFWGMFHATAFNFVIFLLTYSHFRAVMSDPGIVPLPTRNLDFSDVSNGQFPKRLLDKDGGHWTVCQRCEAYRPPRPTTVGCVEGASERWTIIVHVRTYTCQRVNLAVVRETKITAGQPKLVKSWITGSPADIKEI